MTRRQLTCRINTLRDEVKRLRLAGRTVCANRVERELAALVVKRMRMKRDADMKKRAAA